MPNYTVRLPFAGWMDVPVEADTPQDALDVAFDAAPELQMPEHDAALDWQYELHRRLVTGNVICFDENEASVYDEDGEQHLVDLGRW